MTLGSGPGGSVWCIGVGGGPGARGVHWYALRPGRGPEDLRLRIPEFAKHKKIPGSLSTPGSGLTYTILSSCFIRRSKSMTISVSSLMQ